MEVPDDPWGLNFNVKKKGDKACQHQWKKVFEGPRAVEFLGFFIPCLKATHCNNRHMVFAELVVQLRCNCGAELEAVYGDSGRICLICNHSEERHAERSFAN